MPYVPTHAVVAGIAHASIAILGNLSVDGGVRAAVLPVLPSIQRAVQRHVANVDLVESALKLFHCIAGSHRFHMMRVVNTILLCIKQHPAVPPVARWSMSVFDSLAFDVANKASVASAIDPLHSLALWLTMLAMCPVTTRFLSCPHCPR